MNKKTGTMVQIPIRYYNQTKNREIKLGGFLSTATRYLDVRVKGDVTYVPPFINCNLEKLTHKRAFGVEHELALLLVISRFFEADGDVVADGRPAVGGKESGGVFPHEAGQLPHDVGVAEYDGGVAVHVGKDVHA